MPPPQTAALVPGSPFVIGAQAGADYADLNLFQVAQAKDLETPNQRIQAHLQDGHFDVSHTEFSAAAGWVTSEANHIEITCEPGAEHDGTSGGAKCGIYTSDYSSGAVFNVSVWCHRIAAAASGPFGTNCFACGELAAAGDAFYLEELVLDLGGSAREGIQVNTTGGTTSYLSNISIINQGSDYWAIWQQNAGTNYFSNITIERTGTAAAFRNEYGASIVYKNCIVYGGGAGVAFDGSFAAGTDYNISDDATAPGTNNKRGTTPTFIGPDDNHLDPSDTVARGWGEDLSADANYPFQIDIDSDPRPAPGQWDAGCDQVAVTGPTPLEGAVSASVAVSATLTRRTSIAAGILPGATISATLTRKTFMAGTVLAGAVVSSSFKVTRRLTAAITAGALVTVTSSARIPLSGSITAGTVVSATLTRRTSIAASITAGTVVLAAPEVPSEVPLAGAVLAEAVVSSSFKVTRRLTAAVQCGALFQASSRGRKIVRGSVNAAALVTAALRIKKPMAGSITAGAVVNSLFIVDKKVFSAVSAGAVMRAGITIKSDFNVGLEDILVIPGSGKKRLEVPGSGEKVLKTPGSGLKILEI